MDDAAPLKGELFEPSESRIPGLSWETLIKIIKVLGGQTFKFHFHRLKRESNQRGNCMDLQPLNLSEFICFFELRIARDEGGVFP